MTASKRTRKAKSAQSSPDRTAAPVLTVDIQDAIRLHAYRLYEQRGCEHGFDREDWLRAEREVLIAART